MSRAYIASHLGMQVETVCRAVAALQRLNLVRTDKRTVQITGLNGLRRRTESTPSPAYIPQTVVALSPFTGSRQPAHYQWLRWRDPAV